MDEIGSFFMEKTNKKSYSDTVFLPKTSFSMKANLSQKEPEVIRFWENIDLYHKILEKNKNNKKYFLHDGPPYANGHIHIGHALNKILKDFVVKSHSIMGYYSPYIPGWDCHGLPIEQQLLKELKISKRHIDNVVEFRKKARDFASKFINIQREEFKRLGILGEWNKPYITMSNDYESAIVRAFIELLEKGYIERDKKTIYWCPICETALADAEVEYKDHTSPSIFVKFKVKKSIDELKSFQNLFVVIWTTTPWTLFANIAVAINKDEDYVVLESKDEHLIVASKLYDYFSKSTNLNLDKKLIIKGEKLIDIEYEPPLIEYLDDEHKYNRRVIFADFVDMTTGTGIVHIAPGHGEEDYFASKKWNIEVYCPVDEFGRFTRDISHFYGKFIFDANPEIIEVLENKNLLISSSEISHSYPHCWRCKQPIIFRATEQWFLKIDKNSLRDKLLDSVKNVNWIPKTGYERISSMIKLRPDWCLSRQRHWGTPIIAFYCKKCNKIQKDFSILYNISDRIKREGSDFWFEEPIKNIIGNDYKCECGSDEFEKEKDILDVWLDSGVSWYAVCNNGENSYPADLYLEGSDQHRGWFQTSLIPSVALNSIPPYKTVLTHGFVLDGQGRAMHKSLGNVVSPDEVIKHYGAEILRLWVCLSNWHEDIRISKELLSIPVDMYRKIRNTIRYLLGNLSGFNSSDLVEYNNLIEMDKYILLKLYRINKSVRDGYKNFKYSNLIREIADFCINDLSSFYLDALKDRLYTMHPQSIERKSAQTALYIVLKNLLIMLSPILSFTSEEAWQVFRNEIDSNLDESVFLNGFEELPQEFDNERLAKKWERIISIREKVLKEIENQRKSGIIGSSLEAKVVFYANGDEYSFISKNLNDIITACIVSQAQINSSDESFKIIVKHADGNKCHRCWQWHVDVGNNVEFPDLCHRCVNVVKNL